MRSRILAVLSLAGLMLGGCATKPQLPVALSGETLGAAGGRVGVAMTPLPKVDTSLPGAGCLLCLAAASIANSSLTDHAHTLPIEELPQLKARVADLMRKKGADTVVIEEELKLDTLASNDPGDKPNIARKDFRPLRDKYRVDKLVVLQVDSLGFVRTYSAYIPTSDPKGVFQGVGYMVDLKDNHYEWYQPVDVTRSAEGKWDEPPKFPGLTNAYFQALELGQDRMLEPFKQ